VQRMWIILRALFCLVACVTFASCAVSARLSGQPVSVTSRYGFSRSVISADRASLYFGLLSIVALLGTILACRRAVRELRSIRRHRRAFAGLCVYCGQSRAGLPLIAPCTECGMRCERAEYNGEKMKES